MTWEPKNKTDDDDDAMISDDEKDKDEMEDRSRDHKGKTIRILKLTFFIRIYSVSKRNVCCNFIYRNVEFKLMLILHHGALKALSRFKYKYSLQIFK